jgi:hydroxymethylpyrimidine pyrophosphatase-like HAD family hydrolase
LADVVFGLGYRAGDVLAIGDGRNDIEMLSWAGRGVAIGDACAEVKAVADDVTGTFADCGAAQELDRWFNRQRASSRFQVPAALAS